MLSHFSDTENVSPPTNNVAGFEIHIDKNRDGSIGNKLSFGHMRKSSAILQEIVNSSTVRRPKTARPRVTSSSFLTPKANEPSEDVLTSSSPRVASTAKPPRSLRLRSKMGRPRRSTSGDMRQYVDHLEAELETALAERNSPDVAREQSAKIRQLKIETKRQQQELADWDKMYEQRISEEAERHQKIEVGLRARLRTLEHELDAKDFRVQELECDLECTQQNMTAAETANVNLEKRLEIMSELLAASPTKLDLHIDASGKPRHGRQKSMLPRLPAVGPMMSPVRQSFGFPMPPQGSPSPSRRSLPMSPARYSPAAISEEGENSPTASLPASADMQPQPYPDQHARPVRRMRRFCGGSLGPKPLILPSTSLHERAPSREPATPQEPVTPQQEPAATTDESAAHSPPLNGRTPEEEQDFDTIVRYAFEHPQTRPGSPARRWSKVAFGKPDDDDASYTSEDQMLDLFLDMSPQHLAKAFDDRTPSLGRSEIRDVSSEVSRTYSRNYSSLGSMPLAEGPTLEEELVSYEDFESGDELSQIDEDDSMFQTDEDANTPTTLHDLHASYLAANSRFASDASTSVSTTPVPGTIVQAHAFHSMSTIDSWGHYFSSCFHAPILLARHLVETAQNRARLPGPIFTIQWWLVGLLVGPMAKRELLRANELSHNRDRDNGLNVPLLNNNVSPRYRKHSPWIWLKFSLTLAVAVGIAFKDGPGSLLGIC